MKNTNKIDQMIGQKIKTARKEKGYTLEQLAAQLGSIHFATLNHYEQGIRSVSIENLIKICGALQINYKELLDEIANEI